MMDDPVYQSFILPNYRQEKIARRQAEQKILIDAKRVEEALQAQQKAQQKAQQAEQNIYHWLVWILKIIRKSIIILMFSIIESLILCQLHRFYIFFKHKM